MSRNQSQKRPHSRQSGRRTFLKGIGASAALAAMAGCLGGGDSGNGNGNGNGNGDGGLEETLGEGMGEAGQMTEDGTITIRFWPAWGGFYEEQIKSMVEDFESENDGIEISLNLLTDYRDSRTAAFTNIDGGDPAQMPDIAHFDTNDTIVARDTGWFQPVESVLQNLERGDMLEPAVSTSIVNDTWWGLPFYISNVTMHYNADMIAEAGFDPDDPPASLAEVREVGEACVEDAGAEYALTVPNDSWFVESWVSEQDEFWLDNKNGHEAEPETVYATEDYAMEVVNWWGDLASDGLYFNGGIENWTDPEAVFLDGDAPMNINSSTSVNWVDADGFEVRTAPLPTVGGDGVGHSRGGAELWITNKNRTDEEREALGQFLEFIASPENQAAFHKASGYYPAHSESWEILESEGFFEENPRNQVLREQIESWEPRETNIGLMTGENPAITDVLTNQMNAVFGGKDPESAMQTVKQEGEVALARYQRAE